MATPIPKGNASGRRILLTAVGSLGDLHPYLALATELARRGHCPVVASTPALRERVEAAGIAFHPLRATTSEEASPELIRRIFQGRKGMEFIVRKLLLPALRTAYEDTCAAAQGADLLIGHPLTYATRFVAETRGLPWVSTQLAPFGMMSAWDPPLLPGLGWLRRLRAGPAIWRTLFELADRRTRPWMQPVDALRTQLGLPDRGNPLLAGGHSPVLELALFSPDFAAPQPDWTAQTVATGFPFFEQPLTVDPVLEDWLAAGEPPVVFTLGSSAVMAPGTFFRESAAAARRLGRRALLLGARLEGFPQQGKRPAVAEVDGDVLATGYAGYARVFPRAAAVVHQGGIGTTAEALRSGRPMLVMPYGVDQPDNAARAVRLGVARTVSRRQYRANRVARELDLLLGKSYVAAAQQVGRAIRKETGAATACDAIERLL